jgi:hypothetical protein
VVGNGPSLNLLDMGLLKDEITFGANRAYYGFDDWGHSFNYWSIEDRLVAEDIQDEWNRLAGPVKFIPRDMAPLVANYDNLCWLDFQRHPFAEAGPAFEPDTEQFHWGGTVTYLLLQLAIYMGCNPIYLIGVDFSYVRPDHVSELDGVDKWISGGDDPNHFFPDYFGQGRKWHDPKVERMGLAFARARQYADRNGVRILNATPGTKLDVFEKVEYESLFNMGTNAADR